MRFSKLPMAILTGIISLTALLTWTVECRAQGKQAILILRSNGADPKASGCDGTTEISFQLVSDVKLNSKDEVRLMSGFTADGPGASVGREAYEHSSKIKAKDLYMLKWGTDGVLYAWSVSNQTPVPVLPDNMKPQKNAAPDLSSFYGVTLTAEAKNGKDKRKISLGLREIWKVYFIPEGANVNDTLFTHAAEEKNVSIWEAFLRKTNNFRSSEANAKMRDALIECSQSDLTRFVDGDYNALAKARERVTRAQSIREDDASRQLAANIQREQQKVSDSRAKAELLIKAEKWDEAIGASEPIRKYLETWPDLNDMYKHALDQSYEIHLNAGSKAFLAGQLDVSLTECTTARSRLPNLEGAILCVCKARNEIALRDEKKSRNSKRPKEAKELLEAQLADADCKPDPRLVAELKVAKCEYAQQLYAEARQLLGVGLSAPRQAGTRRRGSVAGAAQPANSNINVKLITLANKADFRNAREKLMLASEMCADNDIHSLLATANRQLAGFCVAEAGKASQRNDNGTAYVYLQKAQGYTPEDGNISQNLERAKEKFQEQTRVNVGVTFDNRSGNGYAEGLLNELAADIESASTEAGLSQPAVVNREGTVASLRAIQAGRPLDSPTVIFFGELINAAVRIDRNPFTVSSAYSYPNPERQQWDRSIDVKNSELDNCKKQYGDAGCAGVKSERDRMRAYRDGLPRNLQTPYSYTQTDFKVQGSTRLSFRSTDSISRVTSTVETLAGDVAGQCSQRENVHDNDTRGASNVICQIDPEGNYLSVMFNTMKSQAHARAVQDLRNLPFSYFKRAQTSANKLQSVESYLRFLFLTSSKSGIEAEQAKAFLIAYDPELKTDGVMR